MYFWSLCFQASASESNSSDTFTLSCGVCFCGESVSCYFALYLAVFLMSLSLALLAVFVFHPSSISSLKSNSTSSFDRSLVVTQLNRYKVLYLFLHMVAPVGLGWCEVLAVLVSASWCPCRWNPCMLCAKQLFYQVLNGNILIVYIHVFIM